jgi:hypothetical protein
MHDARRVLVRLLEGGVILDRRRIEDHDVGEIAGREKPTSIQLQVLRGSGFSFSLLNPIRRASSTRSGT